MNLVKLATESEVLAVQLFTSNKTRLGNGHYDPARDFCALTRSTVGAEIEGVIMARPSVLVHGLVTSRKVDPRPVIDSLISYGMGFLAGRNHTDLIFFVDTDNTPMHEYLKGIGASLESPTPSVFRMEIK